jgi:hypothetical protein
MNTPKNLRYWYILAGICVFITLGCSGALSLPRTVRTSYSCQEFDETLWKEFRFGLTSPETIVDVLETTWRVDKNQIRFIPQPEDTFRVEWETNHNQYSALFRDERQLVKVDVWWQEPFPTLSQIMDCLGPPEQYQAFYEQVPDALQLQLSLWYPKKGFVVDGYSFHLQRQPPEIHPEYPMRGFITVASDAPERMVMNVYTHGNKPNIQTYGLRLLKPWPGSIEAIEVDSCLDSPSLCRTDAP